jgi:uncharacterized membrane protein YesL
MEIGFRNYAQPGPGIERDSTVKTGVTGFWDIFKREWWQLIKLNWIFLLGCVPVVTIPASVTAMCWVLTTMADDRPRFLWNDFWRVFRREFWRSLLLGWLWLLGCATVGTAVRFYASMAQSRPLFWAPAAVMLALFAEMTVMSFDLFPMLANLSLEPRSYVRNAFCLSFVHAKTNLILLLILIPLLTVLILLFPYSALFPLAIGFSFCGLIVVYGVNAPIKKYAGKKEPDSAK